jgi:glycopeptide antibiotics resistance protein
MKRFASIFILAIYSALLIKVMVFKDIPVIRIGHLMFNFGGTDATGQANFIPFKTILPYFFGYKGAIIAGINLIGNIALLVPVGLLAPFIYQKMSWGKSLALGLGYGLAIEGLQVILRVGIFDIDDVILNALGVVLGYLAFVIIAKIFKKSDTPS